MSTEKRWLNDRDRKLIGKFLLGGAAVGGGTALLTAFANRLKNISDSRTSDDDDTLYVYRKEKVKQASLGGGVAIAGGTLSAVGAYALVNSIIKKIKKREAQNELDAAQNILLDTQGYSKAAPNAINKAASSGKPMSVLEATTSLPVALPLLLGTGSAALAYLMLARAYPNKKPKVNTPKRIEIVDNPNTFEKPANVLEQDGLEFLLRTINSTGDATSDIKNLIKAAATGELQSIKYNLVNLGAEATVDLVKYASDREVDPFAEHIAISCLAHDPLLSPVVGVIAAGEFAESFPTFFKSAATMDDASLNNYSEMMQILGSAVRSELSSEFGLRPDSDAEPITKIAFTDGLMDAALDKAVNMASEKEEASEDTPADAKIKIIPSSKSSLRLVDQLNEDIVNKILTPTKS